MLTRCGKCSRTESSRPSVTVGPAARLTLFDPSAIAIVISTTPCVSMAADDTTLAWTTALPRLGPRRASALQSVSFRHDVEPEDAAPAARARLQGSPGSESQRNPRRKCGERA